MHLKPVLLHLSNTLLKHSHIPSEHQVAWAVATQHLTAVDCCFQVSTALALTVTVGQCTQLNTTLQKQLTNLIQDHCIIDVLLDGIDHTLAASQHDTTAALVRAIHSLALLNSPSGSPQHTADPGSTLSAVFQSVQHRQRLLQAACSSPAGAEAVAALVVTAASVGLPAANLLQNLRLLVPGQHMQPVTAASTCSSSSSSLATRKAWVAVGLRPLLLQVQRQLQLQQQSADGSAHDGNQGGTSTEHQQQRQHSLPTATGFQQLWLLPCMALQVADGQLLDSATLGTIGSFLLNPAVQQVLKMALLVSVEQGAVSSALAATLTLHSDSGTAAGVATAAQRSSSSSSSSNSSSARQCTHPSHGATLRLPTLQLIRHAAAHSASLAQRCFDSLAPVLPDVLQACKPCPYCLAAALQKDWCPSGYDGVLGDVGKALEATRVESAEARAAVLQVWHQLLLKGCSSYSSRLHSLLQTWLPVAAEALAAATAATEAACGLTPPASCQQGQRVWQQLTCPARCRAEAIAAAFVPLAWQLQAASKPFVCLGGPAAMVRMLTPHVPALVQLVVAGASKLGRGGDGAAAAAGSPGAGSQPVDVWVLLLAMWLLQSWEVALQQQLQQQQGSVWAPVCAASASTGTSTSRTAATQLHQVLLQGESGEGQQSAASILAAMVPQLVTAVAELVAAVGSTGAGSDSVQVRCQTKGLDLAHVLLALQSASGLLSLHSPSVSSSSNSIGSSSSSNEPTMEAAAGCWEQLVSALGGLVSRHPRDPMSLAHRQLLQTACLLLGDLAGFVLAPITASVLSVVITAQAPGSTFSTVKDRVANLALNTLGTGTQPQQEQQPQTQQPQTQQRKRQQVWQDLYSDLQVLHEDLVSRKLVRSSSRKELLQAVGDVVGLLGVFRLGA